MVIRNEAGPTSCFAPSVQLFLKPDGRVLPCSVHLAGYGNIATQRLSEIWEGVARRFLVESLDVGDFSRGCEGCAAEIAIEGVEHAYPAFFKVRAGHLDGRPQSARWPRWIDFNMSTACNLQCVQCSGDLSSAIRIHREKRSPLVSPYGDQFFEDLRAFVPHLNGALFAGGEPFLGAENYRAWDLIAELNPGLSCTVTTNATQWNKRVERVLEQVRMSFVFSLDGFSESTFEAVRVGADRDEVFANVIRFTSHARRTGGLASVNHCLMVQNYFEFADLLLWGDEMDLDVNVSVVRTPAECSIAALDPDEMAEVFGYLSDQSETVLPRLGRNAVTWTTELHRIGAWLDHARRGAEPGGSVSSARLMMFRRVGTGAHDAAASRVELAALSVSGAVGELVIGSNDMVNSYSGSVDDEIGVDATSVIGRNYALLEDLNVQRFGPLRRQVVREETPDRVRLSLTYGETTLEVALVAVRGRDGVARSGRVLVAVAR